MPFHIMYRIVSLCINIQLCNIRSRDFQNFLNLKKLIGWLPIDLGKTNRLKAFWNPIGIGLGSSCDHFGMTLGSIWNHLDITLGSFWGHFEIILGSCWDRFEITLQSFWDHIGIPLRLRMPKFTLWWNTKLTVGDQPQICIGIRV